MIDLSNVAITEPPEQEQTSIDLSSVQKASPLPENIAEERSKKFILGLKDILNTSEEMIRLRMKDGDEEGLRKDAVVALENRETIRRQQTIEKIARERNKPLTREEYRLIMMNNTPFDPESAPEGEYAKYYTQVLNKPDTFMADVYNEGNPDKVKLAEEYRKTANDYITKVEMVRKAHEDAKTVYDGQSWIGWGVDQAKRIFFPYEQVKTRGNVPEVGYLGGGFAQSTNLAEQRKALFRLPLPEFTKALSGTMKNLNTSNPTLAVSWSEAMIGQSSTDEAINDAFMIIDASTAPGLGLAAKGIKSFFSKATKDLAKSAVIHGADRAAAEAAAGNIEHAAVKKAAEKVTELNSGVSPSTLKGLDDMVSALRVEQEGFKANPVTRLAQNLTNRLVNTYEQNINSIREVIANKINVTRTPILQATEEELEGLSKVLKGKYASLGDSILDISKPIYDKLTTTFSVDLKFGTLTGKLFESENSAKEFAKVHGILSAVPEQVGGKYALKLSQDISETEGWVRDLLVKTAHAKDPDSFINAWVGWLRNPDDILSMWQRQERKNVTYGISNLLKVGQDAAKAIRDLQKGVVAKDEAGKTTERMWRFGGKNRERWADFKRTLNANKEMDDATRPGEKGYFFKSTTELEHFYQNTFNRLPDQAEIEAYFAYKTITEMDYMVRNLMILRNMKRAGAEQHQFQLEGPTGKKIWSGFFNGIRLNHMPGTDDTLVIFGKTAKDTKVTNAEAMRGTNKRLWDQLKKDVQEGRKIVLEIWDTEARPLSEIPIFGQSKVRYVIADRVESKALEFEQLPRRGGGHFEYEYDHYLKQARVRVERTGKLIRHWYEGDTTIMPIAIRAMGKDAADKLNVVRELIKKNDWDGAKAAFNKWNVAGLEWKEVKSWFNKRKIDGVEHPPMLDKNEPIMLVGRDTKIIDISHEALQARYTDPITGASSLRNGTTSGSRARELQVQFTGERDARDLYTITNEGTKDNPLYKWTPAKFVDPILTMDRSFSKIANTAFMDDYKIMSVETWLEKAKDLLKATPQQIRSSPFHHFHNPEFRSGADKEEVARLKIQHWQIQQFMGIKSETDNLLHSSAQKLADVMYNKFGSIPIDPVWLAPKLKDPFAFMRSIAFHAKLGMFAVPQFLVQAQTYTTIAGIVGGRSALQSMGAAAFSRYAMINSSESVLKHMDTMMTRMKLPGVSWKPGEWLESNDALKRTGFLNVGREVALRDDITGPQLIRTAVGNFFDAGTVFFTEGERFARMGAWHAAYKEFRKATPVGRLTDDNIKAILERADTLTVNMSRASSSTLHSGIWSVPTQFLTYQIRLAELMWGKRLTQMEKARLLAYQSAMYGIPVGLSATGLPLADYFKKAALENGYVVGDSWVNSALTEGLPAAFIAMLTGEGDMSKGLWMNFGDRFGSGGFETLREATRGDKTLWDVLGGAGLSVLKGFWDGSDGFREAMLSGLREDNDKIPITYEDVLDVFKEISSVNNTWKAIAAINTGRWYSKKEAYLTDVSKGAAIAMAITGLQPQGTSDLQLMSWSLKDKEAFEKDIEQKAIKEIRRAINVQNDNPEQARKYFTRAFALLNVHYPLEKRTGVIAKALKDYESLEKSMDWSFYIRNQLEKDRDIRLKAFQTKNNLLERGNQ